MSLVDFSALLRDQCPQLLMQVPHPSVHDFYVTAQRLQGRSGKTLGLLLPGAPEDLRFRSHYGGSVKLVRTAWIKMINLGHLPPTCRSLVDYLSALMFMFIYPKSGKSLCAMLGGIDIKTMHKCINPYADALFELNYDVVNDASLFYFNTTHFLTCHQQICFEDRFEGDTGNDCLMSVDGTDFRIAASYKKSLYSYKFKKSALRYEVGICIKTGKICWWNGPFLLGDENDDMIFQQGLAQDRAGRESEDRQRLRRKCPLLDTCSRWHGGT